MSDNGTASEPAHESALHGLHVLSMVVYSLTFLLGTTGNGLVIWITGFKMKKTVNTVWFLNLAIADFVFTAFLPLTIATNALGFRWVFGGFMCKLNSGVLVTTMYSSVFLLAAISLDRCVSVVAAVWAHNFRTVRKAYLACFLLWAAALLMSSPYFAFRDTVEDRNVTCCSFRRHNYSSEALSSTLKTLTLVRFLFAFVFPFLVIVSCYVLIAQRYRATQRQRSYKPLRIVVAVVLTFFVCWLPFHVLQLVELRAHVTDDPFLWMLVDFGMPIATGLAFFNSCMNPILYVCMCQDFREKFRKSFLLVIESAFVEEGTLYALSASRRSTVQMESLVNGNKQDSTAG
ncbi:chemerin-like receptor 1 [Acipenser ruthenus]|uniref:chemerin-like receptor 1 n=1 Tax=Acipenser ruthenus TaxID=7906 RepID=UPI0027424E01|nr:chemerin-like receptor 1 [Acipenser ruthenus]